MLPNVVAEALATYRAALAEHGMSWGEPLIPYVRLMSVSRFADEERFFRAAFARVRAELPEGTEAEHEARVFELDFDEVLRDMLTLDEEPPDALAVLRLTEEGHRLHGRARTVLGSRPVPLTLLIDNARASAVEVVAGDKAYRLAAGGARLVDLDTDTEVAAFPRGPLDATAEASARAEATGEVERVDLSGLTRPATPARLRLRAGFPCRWSVWSAGHQGWYPDAAPARRDHHGIPYFHGDDIELEVPSEPLTVRVTRGMEYGFAETKVTPSGETLLELVPERLYDAAATGWYGADLHVHLNFVGDLVATPAMAAAMQHGEDLHVLNLLAANVSGPRVFDQEALEHWAGRDLPWSDATHLARMGVEYRNDLLGHLHAFGMTAPPGHYHSGFDGDPDWPPHAMVCKELRDLGAIVGYAHPFMSLIETPEDIIGTGRPQCSARMAVVDAALGLVDSMEILHFASAAGSSAVYRRLLGAGNRLAAVAGSDSMVSFTRQRMEMVASPLGWERTYAKVSGPLTAESYAKAVRRGRTFATTGPFVELSVDGHEPGDRLDRVPGDRVAVTARVIGPEVERLEIRTADGVLADGPPAQVTAELVVGEPTYILAIAEGGPHPRSLYTSVFAHTSPVYVDVGGRRVARPEDVRWCLSWLERLEDLIRGRARFDSKRQLEDHLALIDEARRVYLRRLPR